ncbi:zinc ribbon domain-containing protein [Candidatus Uabimicrobium amorphum]|uniref:Transposase n=1 Tax=Uabimicrobium amorphum TaxID=2596890 RepID=A0A5S9IVG8_UABAM|nr:zinc ribbon domain-containing protein [Candidatus Uabimicrobium amorphum]BBM88042.1 transposase [Candidatus Uabimicrobium amorphum]
MQVVSLKIPFWKPSRRWLFFDDKLQELYRTRREQVKVFLYSLANRLFREYDVVSVGDYTPNGGGLTSKMRRAMNNQSLIGQFKLILNWVANRSGRVFVEWSEKASTRTCHDCDHVVKDRISPEFRYWTCPECDSFHFRDENAARNGLNRTLQKLQMPCSGRRSVSKRRAWRFSGLGVFELPGITDEQVNSYAVSCQEIKSKGDTLKSKDG